MHCFLLYIFLINNENELSKSVLLVWWYIRMYFNILEDIDYNQFEQVFLFRGSLLPTQLIPNVSIELTEKSTWIYIFYIHPSYYCREK